MGTFEAYFLSIVQAPGRYQKLKLLYEPILRQSLSMAFPNLEQSQLTGAIDNVFKHFDGTDDGARVADCKRFEVVLTGILFSGKIEPFNKIAVDSQSKSMIRRLIGDYTTKRAGFFNTYKEEYIEQATDRLNEAVKDLLKSEGAAREAFSTCFLRGEFLDSPDQFLASLHDTTIKLAKKKGYIKEKPKGIGPYSDPCSPQITDVVTAKTLKRWDKLLKGKEEKAKLVKPAQRQQRRVRKQNGTVTRVSSRTFRTDKQSRY